MNKVFTQNGWEDYVYWETEDKKTLKKINALIEDICRNGNQGIGKPEPLTGNLAGFWSRRINDKDRLIYQIDDESLYTGITTDIVRRYEEHEKGKGAKYTRAKGVKRIEIFFQCLGRKDASRIESYIKKLSKAKKEFYLLNREIFSFKIKEELGIEIKIKNKIKKVLT